MDKTIADALRQCLISPNCPDSNGEPANIVDGLYAIAQSIDRLAKAVASKKEEEDAFLKYHLDCEKSS